MLCVFVFTAKSYVSTVGKVYVYTQVSAVYLLVSLTYKTYCNNMYIDIHVVL